MQNKLFKKKLRQLHIFINITVVCVFIIMFTGKVTFIDKKDINEKKEIDKQQLQKHIEIMYKKDIKNIHSILYKKTILFTKKANKSFSSKDEKNMMLLKKFILNKHKLLKEVLPSLSYIAIYDKNLKYLYSSKHNSIQYKEDRHILKQVISEDSENKVLHIIEKSPTNGEVFLVYVMRIQNKSGYMGVLEMGVSMSYMQQEFESIYSSDNYTFDLSLWGNKAGYDDLLISNITLLNYKSLIPYNYKSWVLPPIVAGIVLLLLNILYFRMMKIYLKEEKKVKNILDSQSSLMVIFDKNEIIDCNRAFTQALGFNSVEELTSVHKGVSDFFIHQDDDVIFANTDIFWADYIMQQKDDIYNIFFKDKYGNQVNIFDISVNYYTMDDRQCYIASFKDSSVLHKRKEALQLEKKRSQLIIDNSNDGFIDWNTLTNEIYISKRLKDILGYDENDISNTITAWINLINPEYRYIFLQKIENYSSTKTVSHQSEILLKHKNGKWVWVFSRITIFADENHTVKRFILFFTDIDYKKRQEQIMKDKISNGIEEIKGQQELLAHQSKLASMGEMIGSIAHQWRQPLNELGIKVQSLKFQYKKGLIDEPFVNNFVEHNKKTILFMSKTIDDFRNFYRTDKEKHNFSILEAINFCFSMQSAELANKNIDVAIEGDDFIYYGFDSEFKQVILNLINNAKDAFEENDIDNRQIQIGINNNKITFTDNAGGIPENIITRIFEPYFTTKEQGKGTGIGLHMSKSIIENSLGYLSVKNMNDGACFTIDFSGGINV